ncbi:chromosome segregation protein SMC [Paenibacillus larvae]
MFLKRIELSGFKSFADKTELEFVQGITAVVGPNGSGKSNISDGIRWVLGETSAKSLRGGKMKDVIFAGSDARKAVNYGEVSLTLDNTSQSLPLDFNEVTVTRRVHRSGDSEYFINRQSCRLKDITELFMDTGIGKEAYSIIGQGRIEEILSTKSEERRGIFEEASGIVKYKSRKKESEKKLEDTEQNLLRIHDLVVELEDQVGPLKEQGEKAQQYKALKEELKHNEIAMYVNQIEQVHNSWNDANERLNKLKEEQNELAEFVNRHDAHLVQHRNETKRLEEDLEQLQQTLLQVSEEVEKCEGQGEVLKERKRNFVTNQQQLTQSVEYQEKRLQEKQDEIAVHKQKAVQISAQLFEFQARLDEEERRLQGVTGGLNSSVEEQLKSELLDKLNEMAQTRNEIRYAEQQLGGLSKRVERLDEERRKWGSQKEAVIRRQQDLNAKLEQAVKEVEASRNEYVNVAHQLKEKQQLYQDTQGTVRKWEQKLDALTSRRDTLKEMQNDFEGFMYGVKEVLKARQSESLKGIRGAVAELVKVPEDMEVAIETALGGALQYVVVETEAYGRQAIAYLKKRQLGRATFLPIDVIRGRFIGEQERRSIEVTAGFVGIGVDLVDFDDEYRQVFSSLLGNVIIAESLEDANRIAARAQYRYRVVTLDGDVVNPGGSMTGGSQQQKKTNLLSRQRHMEELENEIRTYRDRLGQLKHKAIELHNRMQQDNEKLEKLREKSEQKRIEEQQIRAELAPLEAEMRRVDDQLKLDVQDRESVDTEKHQWETSIKAGRDKLEELQREEAALQQAIRDAEQSRKENESQKEELQTQLTELKIKVASALQEKQSLQDQLRRLQQDYHDQTRELEANRELLAQLKEDMKWHDQESAEQARLLEELREKKELCCRQMDTKRAERAEWAAKLEQEENHTREQRNQLKEIEERMLQTEVKVNRLDVELDNLLKKLSEEYELTYERARELYAVSENFTATQHKVKELKRSIQLLGEVNLGAIEEYARVSDRYNFLSEQRDDLVEAKTALYQVIHEMNQEMSKRFKTTFDAIRSHFVGVFAKLFGGGRADLILSDPDNLLQTGIEIVAQPPGKKLQNLQLLSGGERALTAIALLFSIIKVKPVPFCVLDEVEAALDEANVSRFAEYLREFSETTQFIVVTHRKGTMEEADVLYGVTMEEGGVSKLVSVRLEDGEEEVIPAS